MSKADLLEIISALPERCLERAISDGLASLVANSEYLAAEQIIRMLLERVMLPPTLRLKAMRFGVQIACRTRNIDLALSRYQELGQLSADAEVAKARSAALFSLAAILLPDSPTKLFKLWQASLAENLPFQARHDLAAIGMMLARCYLGNGAKDQARTICQTIAATLQPGAPAIILSV